MLAFADGDHVAAWSLLSGSADIGNPNGEDPTVFGRDEAKLFWTGRELIFARDYAY